MFLRLNAEVYGLKQTSVFPIQALEIIVFNLISGFPPQYSSVIFATDFINSCLSVLNSNSHETCDCTKQTFQLSPFTKSDNLGSLMCNCSAGKWPFKVAIAED